MSGSPIPRTISPYEASLAVDTVPLATHLGNPGPVVTLCALGHQRTVKWGQKWQAGTAAHWIALTEYSEADGHATGPSRHRLGVTLREEVAACVLGGFGMPFEVGLAAFAAIRDHGLLADGRNTSACDFERILRSPLKIRDNTRKYRFPAQRADRLSRCLTYLAANTPPEHPTELRDWLTGAPGIGPKTASWIVRNHFNCDEVAILDIHIMRAGVDAGVFHPTWSVLRDYRLIEAFFIQWADFGNVRVSDLDSVIWSEQATRSRIAYPRLAG